MKSIALLMAVVMGSAGCAHMQRPERKAYVIYDNASGVGGSGGIDCDAEHIRCFDRCWNRAPPLTSIEEQLERDRKKKELHFSNIDVALDWLRNHKIEVAVGTVVVVAGVAFVVATGGSGALILAPLAL